MTANTYDVCKYQASSPIQRINFLPEIADWGVETSDLFSSPRAVSRDRNINLYDTTWSMQRGSHPSDMLLLPVRECTDVEYYPVSVPVASGQRLVDGSSKPHRSEAEKF